MNLGVDLVVTVDASTGGEDGTPNWASSPTDISAALREFSTPNTSVAVDTTTRTATITTTRGIRASRSVNLTIDVPDTGVPVFGTGVNTYWKFVVKFVSSATGETLTTVLRENETSSPADGRSTQRCRFEVQAVA